MVRLDCNRSANIEKLTSDAKQAKEKKYKLDHGLDQLVKQPVHQVHSLGKLCLCYLMN